jgi:AraC family transcriptional regulator
MEQRSSQQAIHLSEDFESRYSQVKPVAQFDGLEVYHAIQPSSEFEVTFTDHVLTVQMSATDPHNFRQVSRFAGQEIDSTWLPYDFLLVPAKTPALFWWNQTDESIAFNIKPSALQELAIETDCLNPSQVELRPIVYNRDPELEFFARAFHKEMQNAGLGGQLYSESLANLFLIHLLRHYCAFEPKQKSYQGGVPKYKLQQAIDYIQANLDQKLSLEAIAQQLNMSVYYFCELFKQSMGIALHKYVLQQRVERAKQLLKDEERAIVDIALDCGFANQTHLNKHFRKFTGTTPKGYRNQ